MKILFMGTPDIARDCLKAVYEAGHDIVGVVTVPDKPNTRNKKIIFSEVKEFALSHNLRLMQPEKLKDNEEFKKEVESLNPDILCIVAYGKYLPKAYLSMCKYEPINIDSEIYSYIETNLAKELINADEISYVETFRTRGDNISKQHLKKFSKLKELKDSDDVRYTIYESIEIL